MHLLLETNASLQQLRLSDPRRSTRGAEEPMTLAPGRWQCTSTDVERPLGLERFGREGLASDFLRVWGGFWGGRKHPNWCVAGAKNQGF